MATATGQATASSLLLLPLALVVDRPWSLPAPSLAAIGAVRRARGAVDGAGLCRLLPASSPRRGRPTCLLVTFLVPVSAILLGTLFLGETLQPKHFAGMALIGLGLAAIDGRPGRGARAAGATRGPAP